MIAILSIILSVCAVVLTVVNARINAKTVRALKVLRAHWEDGDDE